MKNNKNKIIINTLFIGLFKKNKLIGKGEKYNLNDDEKIGDLINNLPGGKGKKLIIYIQKKGNLKKRKKKHRK